MQNHYRRLLLLLVLVFFTTTRLAASQSSISLYRWNNGLGHSGWELALIPKERVRLLELWEEIGRDLEINPHKLAGTYVMLGYDWGYFLRWSPAKGFVIIPYFDQNLITDFGYGQVIVVDNSNVEFIPERQLNGGRGLANMSRRWSLVLGYFMPTDKIKDFGLFRAGLGEYNEFNGRCCAFRPDFLCHKVGDTTDPASQAIPSQYAHLLKQPITGQIVSVGKRRIVGNWVYRGVLHQEWMQKTALIPVTINAGRTSGVKRNMLFRMIGEPEFYQYLQIIRVEKRKSFGYVVREISDGKEIYLDSTGQEKPLPRIRKGIKVTTSLSLR